MLCLWDDLYFAFKHTHQPSYFFLFSIESVIIVCVFLAIRHTISFFRCCCCCCSSVVVFTTMSVGFCFICFWMNDIVSVHALQSSRPSTLHWFDTLSTAALMLITWKANFHEQQPCSMDCSTRPTRHSVNGPTRRIRYRPREQIRCWSSRGWKSSVAMQKYAKSPFQWHWIK